MTDDLPCAAVDSLEEAKRRAEKHLLEHSALTITTLDVLATGRTWVYEYGLGNWAEQG
jgi:hypothetical protein